VLPVEAIPARAFTKAMAAEVDREIEDRARWLRLAPSVAGIRR
jgi:hypothetical protein